MSGGKEPKAVKLSNFKPSCDVLWEKAEIERVVADFKSYLEGGVGGEAVSANRARLKQTTLRHSPNRLSYCQASRVPISARCQMRDTGEEWCLREDHAVVR